MASKYLGYAIRCDDCGARRLTKHYGSTDLKAEGWTSGLLINTEEYRRTDRCPQCSATLGPVPDVARLAAPVPPSSADFGVSL